MSQGVGQISSNFQPYTLPLADVIRLTISNAHPASLYLLEMLWYYTLHSLVCEEQLRIPHLGKKKIKFPICISAVSPGKLQISCQRLGFWNAIRMREKSQMRNVLCKCNRNGNKSEVLFYLLGNKRKRKEKTSCGLRDHTHSQMKIQKNHTDIVQSENVETVFVYHVCKVWSLFPEAQALQYMVEYRQYRQTPVNKMKSKRSN